MKKNGNKKRWIRRAKLVLGVVLLIKLPISAQNAHQEQFYPEPQSEVGQFAAKEQKLYKTLKLSPAQLKQIDGINDAYVVKIVQLKADKKMSKADKKALRRTAKTERDAQFKSILTDSQRKTWTKLRQAVVVRKVKKMDKKGQLHTH